MCQEGGKCWCQQHARADAALAVRQHFFGLWGYFGVGKDLQVPWVAVVHDGQQWPGGAIPAGEGMKNALLASLGISSKRWYRASCSMGVRVAILGQPCLRGWRGSTSGQRTRCHGGTGQGGALGAPGFIQSCRMFWRSATLKLLRSTSGIGDR
jgi:hypothetical protein